jgi:hypothetical protein
VKLLEIQSSPRGESSDSITLTKSFVEACKSDNPSIVVDTLNVWHERRGCPILAFFCEGGDFRTPPLYFWSLRVQTPTL